MLLNVSLFGIKQLAKCELHLRFVPLVSLCIYVSVSITYFVTNPKASVGILINYSAVVWSMIVGCPVDRTCALGYQSSLVKGESK